MQLNAVQCNDIPKILVGIAVTCGEREEEGEFLLVKK
jgi:hypothetical protein